MERPVLIAAPSTLIAATPAGANSNIFAEPEWNEDVLIKSELIVLAKSDLPTPAPPVIISMDQLCC